MTQHLTPSPRRHDLDAIRVGAFLLLILYHIGMFYVPWDWHVNSHRPVAWLEPLMRLTSPWRLTLLFLVSGAATRLLYDRYAAQGPGAAERLAGSRLLRLALPLAFGMAVIVPPQSYYEILQGLVDHNLTQPLVRELATQDFWFRYIRSAGQWCDQDGCLITPTWNHLWFVAYLLAYGLAAALLVGRFGHLLPRVGEALEKHLKGVGLFVWPILFLALLRLGLAGRFPVTHAFIDDVYTHALSFTAFAFGFLAVHAHRMTEGLVRHRRIFLALALASWVAWAGYCALVGDSAASEPLRQAMRVVYAIDQWAFIAAALGYAARYVRASHPVIRWLGGGIFTFYIVHQTLIVVAAYYLDRLGLPLGLEMAAVLSITLAGCVLSYLVAQRLGSFSLLLGASPRPRTPRGRPQGVLTAPPSKAV